MLCFSNPISHVFIQGVFISDGEKIGLDPSTLSSMAEVSEEHNIPTAVNTAYGTLETVAQ